jgi:asparagine synthase (glutamine-hydrolysing)
MAGPMLLQAPPGPLHTFSAIFDEVPESDERGYIQEVLSRGGVTPHYVHADQLNPLGDLEQMFFHQDEPFWLPNLFLFWSGIHRSAQEQGVRVLLSGEYGDSVVSYGLSYLTELFRTGHWLACARELAALSSKHHRPVRQVVFSHLLYPVVPQALRRLTRPLRRRRCLLRRPELLRPDSIVSKAKTRAAISRLEHWQDLSQAGNAYALEIYDKAAAPFALERRYPFQDRRLLEFCLSLPADQKLRHGWTRSILRRGLAGVVPDKVLRRLTKGDLSFNFDRCLRLRAKERVEEIVFGKQPELSNYVEIEGLRHCYRAYTVHGYGAETNLMWGPIMLGLWLRTCPPGQVTKTDS